MSSEKRKIKNFDNYMARPGYRKLMNQLVIKGEYRPMIFSVAKREFELQIYYTPLKNKIIEIVPTGISLVDLVNNLDMEFKVGDNISLAREWCKIKNHKVFMDIDRFNQ